MGIAHHSNHIVWFEIGRTDLCRAAGFPYPDIEARGFLLVVAETGCRYRSPFRYDDEVVIRTYVEQTASRAVTFRYELFDATGATLRADGFSRHVWVDASTWRPAVAPAEIAAAFRAFRSS
jgi:acyl-CoA thioester hydrolase